MKKLKIICCLFSIVFCFRLSAAVTSQLYDRIIYVDKVESDEFQQSLNDLVIYLKKITSQDFIVKEATSNINSGIYLLLNKPAVLPAELNKKIQSGSIEDFVLSGNKEHLLLVANHPAGLSRAIYTYLDILGVKWYFPGERWEYLVFRKDISFLATKYFSPSFSMRNFFGTVAIRDI